MANGLPICHGAPVAVDAGLVSPVRADGTAHKGAADRLGVALREAEKRKARTYPELVGSSRLRLLTAASEVGGRMNAAARGLLETAAHARARDEPAPLRRAAAHRWYCHWVVLLGVAVQNAVAATLVDDGRALVDAADGYAPSAVDLWRDDGAFAAW